MAADIKASTRTRLLDAATAIFARHGFAEATIAGICDDAGANIAAVHYHFGSKEALYKETWLHAFTQATETSAPDAPDLSDAPEAALRHEIFQLVHRIAHPDNTVFAMMEHEFAHPSGVLNDIVAQTLAPHQKRFNTIIAALIGPNATPDALNRCRISIIAQCFHLNRMIRSRGNFSGIAIPDPDRFAEHLFTFSLGGILAVKKECDQ